MRVDSNKRVIPIETIHALACDILEHLEEIDDPLKREAHLVEHLAGLIDAHCILLQRALCVHCGNGIPLEYIAKWDDWLHNGELTCVAGRARDIMGIDPKEQHIVQDGKRNGVRSTLL